LHGRLMGIYFGLGIGTALVGLFTALGSLLIPAWQGYTWLRYGAWPELPLRATWCWLGWPLPETDWLGAESVLLWFFNQGTCVVLLIVGLMLLVVGAGLVFALEEAERAARRAKE
jgi:hypothetical protein